MSRILKIKELLTKELTPDLIEIVDNSKQHERHAGIEVGQKETHLYIKIISKKFETLNKVESHKLVYGLLNTEFNKGLHALELELSGSD